MGRIFRNGEEKFLVLFHMSWMIFGAILFVGMISRAGELGNMRAVNSPVPTRQELCKDPCVHFVCTSDGLWPELIADYERCLREGGKDITNRD